MYLLNLDGSNPAHLGQSRTHTWSLLLLSRLLRAHILNHCNFKTFTLNIINVLTNQIVRHYI